MRAPIRFEDEGRDSQPFWTCALPHLLTVLRLMYAAATGALLAASSVKRPISVLDVQRSSSWPSVRVTRDSRIIIGEGRRADGFEVAFSRRGYTWTLRAGQAAPPLCERIEARGEG